MLSGSSHFLDTGQHISSSRQALSSVQPVGGRYREGGQKIQNILQQSPIVQSSYGALPHTGGGVLFMRRDT